LSSALFYWQLKPHTQCQIVQICHTNCVVVIAIFHFYYMCTKIDIIITNLRVYTPVPKINIEMHTKRQKIIRLFYFKSLLFNLLVVVVKYKAQSAVACL